MMRYHDLLLEESKKEEHAEWKDNMIEVARICKSLSERPAQTFHEALQAVWFLLRFTYGKQCQQFFSRKIG